MKRRVGVLLLSLAVLAAAWLAYSAFGGEAGSWLTVQRRNFVVGVPTEGELRAIDSVLIGPPSLEEVWRFTISMIGPDGGEVEAGQPVLGFDTTELRQRLQQATADADSAEKKLEKASTDFDIERRQLEVRVEEAEARLRRAELGSGVSSEVVAASELLVARIDQRLARLEIESLESSRQQLASRQRLDLASLQSQLEQSSRLEARLADGIEQMTVTAPRSGTLIVKTDWRQEKKEVGDQVWRADKVLEIPDLRAMEASAEVDEAAAGRLEIGQSATLRLDAYPDREYRARITHIRRVVQRRSRNSPARVVKLTLGLEATDTDRMRPGMRFRGTIAVETSTATLTVPRTAVYFDLEGPYVLVKTAFGRRQVRPLLGRINADLVEVLDGLDEGDRTLRRRSAEEVS